MTITFHLSVRFPRFLERWGLLPDCFVLERKHKAPKRLAEEIRNTNSNWERSVMRETTSRHFSTLDSSHSHRHPHFQVVACLVDPYTPSNKLLEWLRIELRAGPADEIRVASKARINEWEICSRKDVVRVKGEPDFVGSILMLASISHPGQQSVFAGIKRWTMISTSGTSCSKWRCTDEDLVLVAADEIMYSLLWAESGGWCTVLAPMNFRS